MQSILFAILPMLSLILFGYGIAQFKFLNNEQFNGISTLAFTWLIPSLLFLSMYQSENLHLIKLDLLLAFYIPIIVLFFISLAWFKFQKVKAPKPAYLSLAATFSNNVLIGVPILISLIGEQVILPAFFIIAFHSLLLFSLTSFSLASESSQSSRWYLKLGQTLWMTSRSPIVFSLMLGLALNYLNIALPEMAIAPIQWLKQAALPIALIVLGGSLQRYSINSQWQLTGFIVVAKLLLLPLLIWILSVYVFNLEHWLVMVMVVMSASPVGINVYMFSAHDQSSAPQIASMILISTLLSIITIPLWIYWLNHNSIH